MTEEELFENVRDAAGKLRWRLYHTRDSRRSDFGFPDLVLVSRSRGRLLFVELKSDTGRLRSQQEGWLVDLETVGLRENDDETPGYWMPEVYLWRPRQWIDGTIEGKLR